MSRKKRILLRATFLILSFLGLCWVQGHPFSWDKIETLNRKRLQHQIGSPQRPKFMMKHVIHPYIGTRLRPKKEQENGDFPALREHFQRRSLYIDDCCHFNADGLRIMADRVDAQLSKHWAGPQD